MIRKIGFGARIEEEKPIEIKCDDIVHSVEFLPDGEHFVSGDWGGEILRRRMEDGQAVGAPMSDGRNGVLDLALSADGKLLVSGSTDGRLRAWNAQTPEKVIEWSGHGKCVRAVDVSPDGTRIASGSEDHTLRVWSLSTGQQLLGPFEHVYWVAAVKFSPSGRLIATATWERNSVRIYDSQDGRLLFDTPITVNSSINQSVAWANDSRLLFVLSKAGKIHCLDASVRKTVSTWRIHSANNPECIVLSADNAFLAASSGPSVSLWDMVTHKQLGSVIQFANSDSKYLSMAISPNYDIAVGVGKTITLRSLRGILPSHYTRTDSRRSGQRRVSYLRTNIDTPSSSTGLAFLRSFAGSDLATPGPQNDDETIEGLRDRLATSQRTVNKQSEDIGSLRTVLQAEKNNSVQLNDAINKLGGELTTFQHITNEQDDIIRSLRAELQRSNLEIENLRDELNTAQRTYTKKESNFTQMIQCEALYAHDNIHDAAALLLDTVNTINEGLREDKVATDWIVDFTNRCVLRFQMVGDEASRAKHNDGAIAAYSTALSLTSSAPNGLLVRWARTMLSHHSVNEALFAAAKFKLSRFYVYRTIYDILEQDARHTEAIECLQQMQNLLDDDADTHCERVRWEFDIRQRSIKKMEKQGDAALDSKSHWKALEYYSSALSLDPGMINIIVKCCRARVGLLKDELVIVDTIIELNQSSYEGYKRKHALLRAMGRHEEAFRAFREMLSKLDKSSDPQIRNLRGRYIDATPLIRRVIDKTISEIPRVLIDMTTGRLYDRRLQAGAFEKLSIFDELRSSMTTRKRIDYAWIRREVEDFYQYVMFSHKWQPDEPTFQMVDNGSINSLPPSPANTKLLRFGDLVRSKRFRWAWSDTCCVNQADKGVQQESVVAMFRWYRGAALTIVHLLGVFSESREFGCLWRSIWNTRGWTYQEYLASKVVQFYTEDWKPYLGLQMFNHKESPLILSEMEHVTNVAAQELATLEPGLDRVREKLYLASKRETTREEDVAYSLFGIFNVALPVIYGEGKQAVGRLLEHILTRSDNVTLLAWTGISGSHHSYLPLDLSVYDEIIPPHVPQPIEAAEMDRIVMALMQSSLFDSSPSIRLYEQLYDLPSLALVSGRLKLSGLVFPLTEPAPLSDSDIPVYCATSPVLGDVQIKTTDNLSGMKRLFVIHPWISPLIDQDFSLDVPQFDLATRALRLLVRLKQPFGALLLASQGRVQYRRVATDSLIMVRVREEVTAKELTDSIRNVDIQ